MVQNLTKHSEKYYKVGLAVSSVASPKKRRTFNALVSNPVIEDFALRYAPRSFRKWSEFAVASAALGGIAYLADFAIGGSITLAYGFSNALWGILVTALIIFLTGIPIAYYAAKYNIDMDLLTREVHADLAHLRVVYVHLFLAGRFGDGAGL